MVVAFHLPDDSCLETLRVSASRVGRAWEGGKALLRPDKSGSMTVVVTSGKTGIQLTIVDVTKYSNLYQ
jgi:hypothetical protein